MPQKNTFEGGILLVDKPEGITSQTAVNAVRRAAGTKQVGHTGTLDPLATGLLCVLVGRAVKASEYAVCDRKAYEATLRLGITTDTQDITGTVLSACDTLPAPETVLRICESFAGPQLQTPPMYSALKVGGKKLYELAREGKVVDREAREITVYSLTCIPLNATDYKLTVECSAGTYIRTLCEDIGKALGCGGAMAALRRTHVGGFDVKDAVSVDQLRKIAERGPAPEDTLPPELENRLIPLEQLFDGLPKVPLGAFHEKLYRSGCALALHKLGLAEVPAGTRYAVSGKDGFFSLGEVTVTEEGPALKSLKLFSL